MAARTASWAARFFGRADRMPLQHLRRHPQGGFQRAAYRDEKPVVRGVDHREVEGEFGLRRRLDGEVGFERLAQLEEMVFDRAEILVRAIAGREKGGAGFQAQPHFEDVGDDLGIELRRKPPGEHIAIEQVPVRERQHAGADLR